MRLAEFIPDWEGKTSVALILLCLAMICFPFSVAATNIALGGMLAVGLLGGVWWQGVMALWHRYRALSLALTAYLLLVFIGLTWSIDPVWGLKILGRHWFWLLLPIVVMLLLPQRNRYAFLAVMSFGLTANLIYCVLQAMGLIDSHAAAGSSVDNPTGHIGHTGFGFIYGIWAAWLLHVGLLCHDRLRWLPWGLAIWSLIMVFMAQGKSGYIVTLVAILIVAARWIQESGSRKIFIALLSVILLVTILLVLGPGKGRILSTWDGLSGSAQEELSLEQSIAVSSVASRLEWWKMSYRIWLEKPILGSGTGSFPKSASDWQAEHGASQQFVREYLSHPHNQYLLNMVRWGIVGLVLLLSLLYFWIRTGLHVPWRESVVMPLVTLTGVALLVHGLSSASMEEHFSTILAVILLGAGVSEPLSTANLTEGSPF